jgi:hypothetical protein
LFHVASRIILFPNVELFDIPVENLSCAKSTLFMTHSVFSVMQSHFLSIAVDNVNSSM